MCSWFQFVLRYVFSRLYLCIKVNEEEKAGVFLFTLFVLVLSGVCLWIVSLSSRGVGQFLLVIVAILVMDSMCSSLCSF